MPFISHDLKLIFAHIPKTGGASMKNAIKKASEKDTCTTVGGDRAYHGNITRELGERFPDYHKMIVVRNSYKIATSMYNFVYQRHLVRRFNNDKELMAKNFPNFKNWLLERKSGGPFNQLHYVKDEHGLLVDTIIHHETMEEDLQSLNEKIGANIILPKKKHHHYGTYDWKDFYDDEIKDIVAEKCKADIEYFNFKFE